MKRNEYAEPTEMAGIAEAETQAAYAWALDYDGDEFPTQPTQRLTPRRITTLALAASLTVIAVAGVVMLTVNTNQPATQAPSPPVVETTVHPAAPSPIPPSTSSLPVPNVRGHNAANEDTFVSIVFANIPTAWIPGGRPTNEELVAHGYQACTVMDRHPGDRRGATEDFYKGLWPPGGPPPTTPIGDQSFLFMDYAATYLCQRNMPMPQAAPPPPPPPPVQTVEPPPPVRTVEPPPAVQAGCTEGATRYSPASGETYTCEKGDWHEGPYGYHPWEEGS